MSVADGEFEEDKEASGDLGLASEAVFAKDWDREEEDEAWASLQREV